MQAYFNLAFLTGYIIGIIIGAVLCYVIQLKPFSKSINEIIVYKNIGSSIYYQLKFYQKIIKMKHKLKMLKEKTKTDK